MHGQAGVAELRLRPHGAERQRPVLDVDELGVALLALDLEVGEHGLAARAPVDDVVVAIDQPLVVEAHEHLAHRARQPLVHREALARPVAGGAEPLQLADDRAARLLLPLPDALDELLAAEVVLASCPRRRAGARPRPGWRCRRGRCRACQSVLKPSIRFMRIEDVLQRVVEGVPDVERAGDVGRRDDDAVRLLRRGRVGAEVAALLPARVPPRLDGGGLVTVGDRGRARSAARSFAKGSL